MRAGDTTLIVQVTEADIAKHVNRQEYHTSLSEAVYRQVEDHANLAGVSLGEIKIGIGGYNYNMDAVSIAFANTEVAGISVTVPYTATLTIATII